MTSVPSTRRYGFTPRTSSSAPQKSKKPLKATRPMSSRVEPPLATRRRTSAATAPYSGQFGV